MTRRRQISGHAAHIIAKLEGCYCGCRQPVKGKALYASALCRKRMQRLRERREALEKLATPLEDRMFGNRYYTNRD